MSAPEDRLAALERENAELRRRLAETAANTAAVTAPDPGPGRGTRRVRAAVAVVLVVLGTLLAPLGALGQWAQRILTDTDRYVATVAPLTNDPVVRSALAGRLTDVVMEQVDVGALLDDVVEALDERGIAPRATAALGALEAPLTSGVRSFVRDTADQVVSSEAFATAWEQANRRAHDELVAVLRGEDADLLTVTRDGALAVSLAGMIDVLKERLVDRGLGIAAQIPAVDATFVVVESDRLVQAQNRYGQVVAVATWLPWLSLALLAAGVLTAVHRARALLVAGLALTGAMVVVGIGLAVGRGVYLDALVGTQVRLDAAEVVFDQLVSFLRVTVRTVGVLGLVVALGAYLAGGSRSARGVRSGTAGALARLRSTGERRGVSTGRFGSWLGRHRAPVRAAVLVLAALVLLLLDSLTPATVVAVAVTAGVLVVLLELVARPPAPD